MPVSGRINRKENLRSKAALKKGKANNDKIVVPKQTKENSTKLRQLDIFKQKNITTDITNEEKINNNDSTIDKSEILNNDLKHVYVRLEDFKFSDKVVNDGKDVNNSDEISLNNNKETTKMSSRRKTKISKELDEQNELKVDKILETPKKSYRTKKDKQELAEIVVETPRKRGGRQVVKVDYNESKVESNSDTQDVAEDCMDVEETSKIDVDPPKRKGRSAIKNKETELTNSVAKSRSMGRRNINKAEEYPKESDEVEPATRGTIDAFLTIQDCSVIIENEDSASNAMEIDEPVSKIKSNVFQKPDSDKNVTAKIRRQNSRLMKNTQESSQEEKQVESSTNSNVLDATKDQDEVNEAKQANLSESLVSKKTAGRVAKTKKPFVVERDEEEVTNKEEAKPEIKIPGLIMLNNIKNRKSMAPNSKKPPKYSPPESTEPETIAPAQPTKTVMKKAEIPAVVDSLENKEKIPGLRMTADLKRRKSELVGASETNATTKIRQSISAFSNKIDSLNKEKEGVDVKNNEDAKKIHDTSKTKVSSAAEIVVESSHSRRQTKISPPSNEPETIAPTQPTKTVMKKAEIPAVVESVEKIPGLRMTADLKRRKSELLGATETNATTKIRQSISTVSAKIEGSKEMKSMSTRSEPPVDVASSTSTRSTKLVPRDDVSNNVTPLKTKPNDSIKTTTNEKIPGLATTQELKENKLNSSFANNKRRQSGLHQTTNQMKPVENDHQQDAIDNKSSSIKRRQSSIFLPSPETDPFNQPATNVPAGFDKIAGMSVTNQINRNQQEKPIETIHTNSHQNIPTKFTHENLSFLSSVGSFDSPKPATINMPAYTNPFLVTPSPLKPFNVKDLKPAGILSKPSPYKRPMSCLDQEDGDESTPKMARFTVEKRQSVTFNHNVEVKEIHGNSFNSATDASTNEDEDLANISKRTLDAIEKTRNQLVGKRSAALNASFSNYQSDKQRSIGGSSLLAKRDDKKLLPKKNSDLSDLISARVKLHQNSSPRVVANNTEPTAQQIFPAPSHDLASRNTLYSRSQIDSSRSKALKKVSVYSHRDAPQPPQFDRKSFRYDSKAAAAQSNAADQSNDDSILSDSSEQDESKTGSRCSIM